MIIVKKSLFFVKNKYVCDTEPYGISVLLVHVCFVILTMFNVSKHYFAASWDFLAKLVECCATDQEISGSLVQCDLKRLDDQAFQVTVCWQCCLDRNSFFVSRQLVCFVLVVCVTMPWHCMSSVMTLFDMCLDIVWHVCSHYILYMSCDIYPNCRIMYLASYSQLQSILVDVYFFEFKFRK